MGAFDGAALLQRCAACARPVPARAGGQVHAVVRESLSVRKGLIFCDSRCVTAWRTGRTAGTE